MKNLNKVNIGIMNIIIVLVVFFNTYFSKWVTTHLLLSLVISILSSIVSYEVITSFSYYLIKNNKWAFKLYWGNLYLKGFWYYEYSVYENPSIKRYGVWKIDQDLTNIYITGYGYDPSLTRIRTYLSSVTELIKNGNNYEIVHQKTEVENPNIQFYAKSSISFIGEREKYPTRFNAMTYIYGGSHTGETHMDKFYKLNNVFSEDEAIEFLRNGEQNSVHSRNILQDKKIALIVMGRTASGKTTTAKNLAKVLNFKYIPCSYYKRLIKPDYSSSDSLDDSLRDKGLDLAINAGIEGLKTQGIVFDSSFGSKNRRKKVVNALVKRVDAIYYVYCLSTNVDSTRTRIEARKGKELEDIQFHASDFKVFEHINASFEEPEIEELSSCKHQNIIYIDTFEKSLRLEENDYNLVTNLIKDSISSIL